MPENEPRNESSYSGPSFENVRSLILKALE